MTRLAGHSRSDLRRRRIRRADENERGESFRVTIHSDQPLEIPGYRESHDPATGTYVTDCGRADYTAFDSDGIADLLDRHASRILDRLEARIEPGHLREHDATVRAVIAVEGYAHTISADLVQRLARLRADLWIEAEAR